MSFILALDQGTTSSRAIVFDHAGTIRAQAQQELTQHYPQPGWVEQDPNEIWSTQLNVARLALQRAGVTAT
ncbi:MAG: FGGY family carbohydrate kinase, partial [Burkholderiales bacterium]